MNEVVGHAELDASIAGVDDAAELAQPVEGAPEEVPTPAAELEASEHLSDERREEIRDGVVRSLHRVYDPEIPVNIYELGLIYDVDVHRDGMVDIQMTLTSPHCPVAGSLPGEVEMVANTVDGVKMVNVMLTWDPPWTPERMSEAARLELNFW